MVLQLAAAHAARCGLVHFLEQGNAGEEHEEVGEGESYQLEMMRCLREINADNNTVGW